jgi:hypothetical protein
MDIAQHYHFEFANFLNTIHQSEPKTSQFDCSISVGFHSCMARLKDTNTYNPYKRCSMPVYIQPNMTDEEVSRARFCKKHTKKCIYGTVDRRIEEDSPLYNYYKKKNPRIDDEVESGVVTTGTYRQFSTADFEASLRKIQRQIIKRHGKEVMSHATQLSFMQQTMSIVDMPPHISGGKSAKEVAVEWKKYLVQHNKWQLTIGEGERLVEYLVELIEKSRRPTSKETSSESLSAEESDDEEDEDEDDDEESDEESDDEEEEKKEPPKKTAKVATKTSQKTVPPAKNEQKEEKSSNDMMTVDEMDECIENEDVTDIVITKDMDRISFYLVPNKAQNKNINPYVVYVLYKKNNMYCPVGFAREWVDTSDEIPDRFKNSSQAVLDPDTRIPIIEIEINTRGAMMTGLSKGIYREYDYNPSNNNLVRTGQIQQS